MIATWIGKTLRYLIDHKGLAALLGIFLVVSGVLFT